MSPVPPDCLNGLSILLVDDDRDSRDLCNFLLTGYGATVVAADSAIKALKLLRQVQPHVLISDIRMPEEDGYQLIEKIQLLTADQGRSVPAIALTACASQEERHQILAAGFLHHVPKPFDFDELIHVILHVTQRAPWQMVYNHI